MTETAPSVSTVLRDLQRMLFCFMKRLTASYTVQVALKQGLLDGLHFGLSVSTSESQQISDDSMKESMRAPCRGFLGTLDR